MRTTANLPLLVGVFIACQFTPLAPSAQVFIKGKLQGESIKNVRVNLPINNASNLTVNGYNISAPMTGNNEYAITVPAQSMMFFKIVFDDYPFWFIGKPGDSISLDVDFSKDFMKDESAVVFGGNNAAGNFLFNKLNFDPIRKFSPIFYLFDQPVMDKYKLLSSFRDSVEVLIKPFSTLYQHQQTSKEFNHLMSYSLKQLMLSELLKQVIRSSRYRKIFDPGELVKFSDNYVDLPGSVYDTLLLKGFYPFFYFNYAHLKFGALKNQKTVGEQMDSVETLIDSLKFTISSDFSSLLFYDFNPRLQENLWGYLLYAAKTMFPTLLKTDDLNYFLAKFPTSVYSELVKPAKPGRPLCAINEENEIFIVDSSGSSKLTYKGLIDLFKDKSAVYIDLWASWCVPCKQEFAHNKTIEMLMKKYNVARLYVSIDEPRFKAQWEDNIRAFCLKGSHILASESLVDDIKRNIYGPDVLSIPRYILVSKNGTVISADAPRPGKAGLLEDLFKAM